MMECPERIGSICRFLFVILFIPATSAGIFRLAVAQPSTSGLQHFTTQQGLSNNSIHGIVQDQRGFIWIVTDEGLNRYDGTRFTPFYHQSGNAHSLPSNSIRDICLLPDDHLALATRNGLCLLNTLTMQCHSFHETDDSAYYSFNNDFTFVKYDHHHIWAGSHTSLYRFDDSLHLQRAWHNPHIKINPYDYAELPFIYPDGSPGFLINRKACKYNPKSQRLEKNNSLAKVLNDHRNVDFITGNKYGIWWLKADNDSLFQLNNKGILSRYKIPVPDPVDKSEKRLFSFLSTQHDSVLWCAGADGFLVRFNMKQHKFLLPALHFSGAPSVGVWVFTTGLLWDDQHNMWAGTAKGLYKYSAKYSTFQIFDSTFYFKEGSVKTAEVDCILQMKEGFWIGTYGNGLFWVNPVRHVARHFHFHFNYKEPGRNMIWNIRRHHKDTLWIGTQDGVLWFHTKNHHYGLIHGTSLPAILDTFTAMTQFVDSHHNLWIGISNGHGLLKYNLTTNKIHIYKRSALPVHTISCITEDENGDLWMASLAGGGLAHWNRETDHFSVFRAHAGSSFEDDKIYTIHADRQGNIWFNAGVSGLEQYNIATGQFTNYSREQGLCSQIISGITGAGDHLWISTTNGLSRMNIHTKQFKNYSAADGLPSNYFSSIFCINGMVYAGGIMNLSTFKDNAVNRNPYPPKVYITDMQIRNKPVSLLSPGKTKLKYSQNYIRFDYTGINYTHGEENRYMYKLKGTGQDWVKAGNARYAIYASLSPGTYTFLVKAANNDGVWSKHAAEYTFTIVPPFWKTIWFFIIAFLIIFSVIYFFYRYRLHQVVRLQRIRDRIAADLHDDMGASLSNINILSTMALLKPAQDKSGLKKMLENIRDDAQQMSEAIDDIVWSVNPKNDSLERILSRMRYYASDSFEAKNIQYVINFPSETNRTRLSLEKRRDFFLIFKEAINNLIKHSGCTRALVDVVLEGNHIKMELTDNGKGFDAEKEFEGNGLKNMQQRAKNMQANLRISSEAGKGSTLTLIM